MSAEILFLSTADWDSKLWTNKQYMARELGLENRVLYVESLGLRRPELRVRDLSRALRRLSAAMHTPPRQASRVPEGVSVTSPILLPWHDAKPAAMINHRLLAHFARNWRRADTTRLLWTYTPTTYGLEALAPTVYHCVDLLAEVPRANRRAILEGEKRLAAHGAVAIASSSTVECHLREVGFSQVHLWPNVAETEIFLDASEPASERASHHVVFGGNLSPYKFDADLVADLVEADPRIRVSIAGPIAEGGGKAWPALTKLKSAGADFVGTLTLHELARLFGSASVGIIPYIRNPYTHGVLPLKVNEYLAAGLAVVSTDLPALAHDEDVAVAPDRQTFIAQVLAKCVVDDSSIARRMDRAAAASWTFRGSTARELVRELASTAP